MRRLLAIDGGGMLGYVPALLLAEAERHFGIKVSACVDLVVGSSTGGIIAAGLAAGVSAGEIAAMYESRGVKIFSAPLGHRLRTGHGLWGPDYPQSGLRLALETVFADQWLSEIPGKPELLIPAYDIERRQACFFKSWKARSERGRDARLVDVCLATSAAPTYFPPALVRHGDGVQHAYVDGGLQANNPAMAAVVEAVQAGSALGDLQLLSLGCGEVGRPYDYCKARTWGKIGWIRPLIDCFMDAPNDVTAHYCSQVVPAERYSRVQWEQPQGLSMDNASDDALRTMRKIAAHGELVDRVLGFFQRAMAC